MRKMRRDRGGSFVIVLYIGTALDFDAPATERQVALLKGQHQVSDGGSICVWLLGIGPASHNCASVVAKLCHLDKSAVFYFDLQWEPPACLPLLKASIQWCLEACRRSYRELERNYKKSMRDESVGLKFQFPWMASIYYNFKIAVVNELIGDYELALKSYHYILATYKRMIEDPSGSQNPEARQQIVNYLRPSSDVGFIRVSAA